jgi:hypothetical protein
MMRLLYSICLAIILLLEVENSLGEIPEKITNCKAKLANGKIIDLTSLDRASNPR